VERNGFTAIAVLKVLTAMGRAAASTLPQSVATLARTDRGNDADPWSPSLEEDENCNAPSATRSHVSQDPEIGSRAERKVAYERPA
jgi:hypothetical protein